MTDRFDIQRNMDSAAGRLSERAQERLEDDQALLRLKRSRLVKLGADYFWDPDGKVLLRRVGSQFQFVRHDRRYLRELKKSQSEAESLQLRMIAGGLFWDDKGKKVYRKSGGHYVLYTRDRRKTRAAAPQGKERRSRS